MQKVYQRINWENDPSTNTPINEDNLNKMDYALDKIDDRVVNLSGYETRVAESEKNAKQSEINAKESEINAKESELKAKEYKEQAFAGTPEGYQALVKQVGLLDIMKSTDTTLHNTKPGGYRLNELVGKTEQKTVAGNQLFDASKLPTKSDYGATVTNNGDGSFTVSGSGTLSASYSNNWYELTHEETLQLLKPGTISVVDNAVNPYLGVYLYYNNRKDYYVLVDRVKSSSKITEEMLALEDCILSIYFFGSKGTEIVPGTVKPMLYQDGDGTWEPFVGHTPSPNPDYPQAIENVGDCVEMISGLRGTTSGGAYVSNSNYITTKHLIPCNSGDAIAIKFDRVLSQCNILCFNDTSYLGDMGAITDCDEVEYTIPSGATYFCFNIAGVTPQTVGKITLTVNGKYVGQIVELGADEMLNAEEKEGYLTISGEVTKHDGYKHKIIEIDNSYDYKLVGGLGSVNNPHNCWFDSNMKLISPILCRANDLLTPPSNAKYLGISYTITIIPTVQKQKVTTFFLDEPLRATDRLVRKDGVINENHKRDTRVFNGSEKWGSGTLSTGNNYIYLEDESIKVNDKSLLTHAMYGSGNYEDGKFTKSGSGYFQIITEMTLEEWKAYLAEQYANGTPVTLECDLAKETLTPLDTASQLALNDMVTFDGVTYIEVDSKVKPTSISGEYGTSQVGAYTIECLNAKDTDTIERKLAREERETLRNMILSLGGNV